jgi:shikimate dehydrogenase
VVESGVTDTRDEASNLPGAAGRRRRASDGPIRAGLIGNSIQASKSPMMHVTEAQAQGVRLTYELFDLAGRPEGALAETLSALQAKGFAGVNVTHPYKQAVIALLDELSDDAAAVGAVNTVVFEGGRRIGYNTDAFGFAESFRRGLPGVRNRLAVQIGAGGAGAAVAYGLLTLGIERVAIVDVAPERANLLAQNLSERFGAGRAFAAAKVADVIGEADGVVNATPIGMLGYAGMPLDAALLRSALWVAEIVYFPLQTELLRMARLAGCRTVDGGGMAVFQAAEAFRLFTGLAPDAERMLRRFREGLTPA